jgi:hypothetical protein
MSDKMKRRIFLNIYGLNDVSSQIMQRWLAWETVRRIERQCVKSSRLKRLT